MTTLMEATITGHMPRKSNSRRVVKTPRGKVAVIKAADAIAWQNTAVTQLRTATRLRGYDGPVTLHAHVFYRSERSDLSDELLADAIEKAGIIQNDRQIVEKHLYRHVDRTDPRVIMRLEASECRTQ